MTVQPLAPSSATAAIEAVRIAEQARIAASQAGDVAALGLLLSESLRYGHVSGLQDSKSDYLAKFVDGRLAYPSLKSTEFAVDYVGGTVLLWVSIESRVITPAGEREMRNKSLTVWDTTGATPQLVAHQPTSVL